MPPRAYARDLAAHLVNRPSTGLTVVRVLARVAALSAQTWWLRAQLRWRRAQAWYWERQGERAGRQADAWRSRALEGLSLSEQEAVEQEVYTEALNADPAAARELGEWLDADPGARAWSVDEARFAAFARRMLRAPSSVTWSHGPADRRCHSQRRGSGQRRARSPARPARSGDDDDLDDPKASE